MLVEFNKHGVVDKTMYIKVNGTKVTNCREAKFLGIILDNRLNFHRQVNNVCGKITKANFVMQYIFPEYQKE